MISSQRASLCVFIFSFFGAIALAVSPTASEIWAASDYVFEPVGEQCHTYGLALWLPYYGTGFLDPVTYKNETENYFGPNGVSTNDSYAFHSVLCPSMTWCSDVRRHDLHYDILRRLLAHWKQVSPDMLGDYPLTPYSKAKGTWMAWQFDQPNLGEGMVQVFRRNESFYEAARFKLDGLDAYAKYLVTNLDVEGSKTYTGRQLMDGGVLVSILQESRVAVITYKKVKRAALTKV